MSYNTGSCAEHSLGKLEGERVNRSIINTVETGMDLVGFMHVIVYLGFYLDNIILGDRVNFLHGLFK